MNLVGQLAERFVPRAIGNRLHYYKDVLELRAIPRLQYETTNLRARSDVDIDAILAAPGVNEAWEASRAALERLHIPDGTGGVNPGDRRAIFHLVSALKPRSVLEVGTHIGASTTHIAAALYQSKLRSGVEGRLVSVDVTDVNCHRIRQWERYGSSFSPQQLMDILGFSELVSFVTRPSLAYAESCDRTFDFIFLDGDHSADTVYREVSVALKLLNPGGVILLHDYFPSLKPLWSNGVVVTGPFMGTSRLLAEGVDATVVPLGGLPWPTKLGSNVTSLALLLKDA